MSSSPGAVSLQQLKLYLHRVCELIRSAQMVNPPPRHEVGLGSVSNDEHERCIIIPSLPL